MQIPRLTRDMLRLPAVGARKRTRKRAKPAPSAVAKPASQAKLKPAAKPTLEDHLRQEIGVMWLRRRKLGRVNARGLHPTRGGWGTDHIAAMTLSDRAMMRSAIAYLVGHQHIPDTGGTPGARGRAAAVWAQKNPREFAAALATHWCAPLAEAANASRMHPVDLVALLRMTLGKWRNIPLSRGLAEAVRQVRGLNIYHNGVVADLIKFFESSEVLALGLTRATGKLWRVPKDGTTYLGAQIINITYEVPTLFDENGKPLDWERISHDTAAADVKFDPAKGTYAQALRAQTPAGRLWLCWSKKAVWLSTDFAPQSPLFTKDGFLV
ncbi:MAG: hypothetical protein ABIH03_00230 [Pseudomonadota bacterium]